MAWRALIPPNFLTEAFNASERSSLTAAQSGSDDSDDVLTQTILEWRAIIENTGTTPDADVTAVPDSCRPWIVAMSRWRLLLKFPLLRQLQTEERKTAYEDALQFLRDIAAGKIPIEDSEDGTASPAGNWNSNEKIPMRLDGNRANEDS